MARDVAREAKREERRALRQERAPAEPEPKAGTRKRPTDGAKPPVPERAVFLVPGLLGFERFSNFPYFADRVIAALRAGLEQSLKQPVPVVAVPIPPTASLRERQCKLVKTLADRLHDLEHEYQTMQVHLVGHSTGGVDCNLLTHDKPVDGGAWSDVDPRADELRKRIRSVVSIASPHQGACITRDPIGRLLGEHDLRGVPPFTEMLAKFTVSAVGDVDSDDFIWSFKRELAKSARFAFGVFRPWELLADLQPSRTPDSAARKRDVVRKSFVTVAGTPIPGGGTPGHADPFFRAMVERSSGWTTGCAEEGDLVQASVARINQALANPPSADFLVRARGIESPAEIDGGHNDGVVNTARQLIDPNDPNELAGVVVADHFDVVGYYDRRVWTVGDDGHERSTLLLSGLLHSGSGFRDRQFFDLYRRVSDVIAAIP